MTKTKTKHKKSKTIICECCKRETPNYGCNKYCNNCSLHLKNLKEKLSQYKRVIKKLRGQRGFEKCFICGEWNMNIKSHIKFKHKGEKIK